MEAEQGPSPSLESLSQDGGPPGPHCSCPPSGAHCHRSCMEGPRGWPCPGLAVCFSREVPARPPRPHLPPLCAGTSGSGLCGPCRGLSLGAPGSSLFAEDCPGLSAGAPIQAAPQPTANDEGQLFCCQGRFFPPGPARCCPFSSCPGPFPALTLPGLSLHSPFLPAPLPSLSVSRLPRSLCCPVPRVVTLLISGVCLRSLPTSASPLSIWCPAHTVSPILTGSPAHHLPWVVQASLLAPGTHPRSWLAGVGARSGGCDRQGRGTQADMIFMLGLQSGAEPEAEMAGAGGWEAVGGWRQKPDEGQLRPLPGEGLLGDTYLPRGTLRPRVGTDGYFGAEFQERDFLCRGSAPSPSFLPVTPGAAGSSEHRGPGRRGGGRAQGSISAGKHPVRRPPSALAEASPGRTEGP